MRPLVKSHQKTMKEIFRAPEIPNWLIPGNFGLFLQVLQMRKWRDSVTEGHERGQ